MNSMALRLRNHHLQVLDQTLLPHKEHWLDVNTPQDMIRIIQALQVRGAPLIGVAAALSLSEFVRNGASDKDFFVVAEKVRAARPTAVNLMNCVDRLTHVAREFGVSKVIEEAIKIFDEDVELCEKLARNGASLLNDGDNVLTHCNTGGLATAGVGTALGAIAEAVRGGKKLHVWVDETRPLLQGARLTTWELEKLKIPFTLITDNMAAALMQKGQVERVIVGADRIARNGDFANKVGTYSLAVLARHHGIPFYVVAPHTTVDRECAFGAEIEVEERAPQEVHRDWAPNCAVWNPAFDVTPAELVTSWVLDSGIYDQKSLAKFME